MKFSLPINKNIAGTLRAWRSEFVSGMLLSVSDFFFKDFEPATNFGTMTVTNYTVNRARYFSLWKFCWFSIDIRATLAAPLGTTVVVSLPVSAPPIKTLAEVQGAGAYMFNAGVAETGTWSISGGQNAINIHRPGTAAFTAGSFIVIANGFIEID